MTDFKDRAAELFLGEPEAPHDLDRVVASGRRALRRRTTLTAVAGTAGTAVVTAAIVVPLAVNGSSGSETKFSVATHPSSTAQPPCKSRIYKAGTKHDIKQLREKLERAHRSDGTTVHLKAYRLKRGMVEVSVCAPGATPPEQVQKPVPSTTPTPTPYTYSEDPATIASRLGDELTQQVKALGFTIIYTRPFAQESSTLDSGNPTYFDGNVDVQLPDGPANIGVQVTHAVTGHIYFDGTCNAPNCTETKLPGEGVVDISHIDSGSDGAMVIAVEIHHADGLVVEAQEANYAFGPEATTARSSQPLTIEQLTQLAEDPAFSF
jgi:hypothetical protein